MKKVCLVILDAFRFDYINELDTPFMKSTFGDENQGRLLSSPGFAQRSALLTGATTNVHGNLTTFAFNGRWKSVGLKEKWEIFLNERYRFYIKRGNENIGLIDRVFRKLIKTAILKKRQAVDADWSKINPSLGINYIESYLADYLCFPEDSKPLDAYKAFGAESVIDKLRESGLTYEYLIYPLVRVDSDDVILEDAVNRILSTDETNLYLLQFVDSDYLIHKSGPDTLERSSILSKVDWRLRYLVSKVTSDPRYADMNFLILGDHGMSQVNTYLDPYEVIKTIEKRLKLNRLKDFVFFVDSTMIRFRVKEKENIEKINIILVELLGDHGRAVDAQDKVVYNLMDNLEIYGDIIFWLDVGAIFSPCFFNEGYRYNGMHGYRPMENKSCYGFMGLISKDSVLVKKDKKIEDVANILSDLLMVKRPSDSGMEKVIEKKEI
jgi:hypothetical protein